MGAVSTYSFTNVQSDHVIVASFVLDQYVLATSVVGQGSVSRSPSQSSYAAGSTVQLTATAASGWTFTGWSGDASGSSSSITVTVTDDMAVTATFDRTRTS